MKTINLLGGLSWKSTATYYIKINEGVQCKLGGLHSAKIVIYSVDFDAIEKLQHTGDWNSTAIIFTEAASNIQAACADFLLICINTKHKVVDGIERNIDIPLLYISDVQAKLS